MIKKLRNIHIPFDHSKFALMISIGALAFALSSSNTPCLEAQSTCAVGSDNVFTGNINLKGNTPYQGELDMSNITANQTYEFPNASGVIKLQGSPLAGNKVMATDVNGDETTTDVYPLSLTINSALKTDSSGNITASDLDPESDLTIGTGTANQVLSVNSGGTALTFTSITGVPSLTGNQAVVTDGAGALTVANLTADKFVISDSNGSLTTTDIIPLSFGANKPIVSDGAGNLTDVTLTADTPMKTDANGNTSASDLDITTDITPGSALQEIRVNAGGTALEYYTPSGGSQDVTKVASGNIIMNSSAGTLPKAMANICWFTQAGTLDDTKTYKLVVNFKLNENEYIQTGSSSAKRMYMNTLFKQSWATDCGDTTNNNNGANYLFWSMTQNMEWDYQPNNSSFTSGYAKSSGSTWEDCCVPIMPYAYNPVGSGVNGTHISANQLIVEFSPAQDSVLSSGYKVGATGSYTSNGMVTGTYINPTYNNYAGWQVMGNFTNPGATQNNTTLANELKFEDFQGFKLGCNSNNCFGGDTTWALYEFSH